MRLVFSENYIIGLNFLLVAILAWLGARTANDLVISRFAGAGGPVALSAPPPPTMPASHNRAAYEVIVQRDIFNVAKATPATPPPSAPPVVDLHLTLLGTSLLTLAKPFAIIDNDQHEQSLYRQGDTIPSAGTLLKVERTRVIIDHDGQQVTLEIPKDQLSDAVPAAPPSVSAMSRARGRHRREVRKTDNNNYLVDRSAVDNDMQNMAQLFTQMRAVPNIQNGKTDGFTLSEIQQGSLFQQMGLQDGDIVKRIGGQDINDPAQALGMLTNLRTQPSINIDVVRGGVPMELNYDIR